MERLQKSEDIFNSDLRFERIQQLRTTLGLPPTEQHKGNLSPLSIGIEIEITWRQAFPELAALWPSPSLLPKHSAAYQEFSEAYNKEDRRLRPILAQLTNVIPKVGFDAYWEFSFLPAKDIGITLEELTLLSDLGILKDDQNYSLHMTIAGIDNDRDAYAMLTTLELLGGTNSERILDAVESKKGAWARKGGGGMLKRIPNELVGDAVTGYEFRTLTGSSMAQIEALLNNAADLSHTLHHDPDTWKVLRSSAEQTILDNGLPLAEWQKPKIDTTPWLRYAALLDSLDTYLG